MEENAKRKAEGGDSGRDNKKNKHHHGLPRDRRPPSEPVGPTPGDSGIWVSCNRGSEAKCTAQMRELISEYASKDDRSTTEDDSKAKHGSTDPELDIEAEIRKEISAIQGDVKTASIVARKVDVKCLIYFKTGRLIDPVNIVKKLCEDAASGTLHARSRSVKRLTPVTLTGRATQAGIEELCKVILQRDFHAEDVGPKKFAIRPTFRNHTTLKREAVIKQVAAAVGNKHSVDLKNYDHLILMEIYKSTCGMSVVGPEFERLKRFSIGEIWNPTPPPKEQGTKTETDA